MPPVDANKQSISLTEIIKPLVDTACALAILYVSMNPQIVEQAVDWIAEKWHTIQYSASVNQAISAIRNLPETKVTEETNNGR